MFEKKQYGKFAATAATVMFVTMAPVSAMAESSGSNQSAGVGEPTMQPMESSPKSVPSPVPPLTDEDRKAVFTGGHLHDMGDKEINYLFLLDNLEWQNGSDGGVLNWNGTGWVGGDVDRLWLRSEGKRTTKGLEDAEVQALWGHSIGPWWDVVGGVRHNFKPGRSQTWAAVGIQGLALYNFETQATAFVGQSGQTSMRLEGTYDFLITNRLILQPSLELNIYGKSDAAREQGLVWRTVPWVCVCDMRSIVSLRHTLALPGIVHTATPRALLSTRAGAGTRCRSWPAYVCGSETQKLACRTVIESRATR